MKRRFVLSVFAAVGLAALTSSVINVAAQEAPPPGTITTVAGTGQPGFSGDGGPATQARLNWPIGSCVDAAGNLYFADNLNNRIRKVSPSGIITTVAGTGVRGFSGDGGPATEARLDRPVFLTVDRAGNLYFSQWANQRVRKVSPEGIITTVAGSGPTTSEVAGAFAGDGGPATAARFDDPQGLAVDAAGNLFIAETGYDGTRFPPSAGSRVRKVSADGIISTVAGTGATGFSGDGGLATEARLNVPHGVAVDIAGNLFIADWFNYRVRKVDPNGIISTVAGMGRNRYEGDGVSAMATGLRGPLEVTVDAAGNLLISDTGHGHEADGLGANERVLKVFGAAAPGLLAGKLFPSSP